MQTKVAIIKGGIAAFKSFSPLKYIMKENKKWAKIGDKFN